MKASTQKVMLVDDDVTITETLDYNLRRHGFDTTIFHTGKAALAGVGEISPDLIVLDWMLPDLAGPEFCKVIRSRFFDVPILMLTGRATPTDVAEGLTSGADDYLTKPFSIVELMARIQALLRRSKGKIKASKIALGPLMLDEEAHRVTWHGENIDLSPKEFMLLKTLMHHAGKALSAETLLNEVWGMDFTGDVKTVAVHIRWLRQKLEKEPHKPKLLETVHRFGYRLNPP